MVDKDVYYQVILDGFSRYLESPFMADVTRTIIRYPDARFYVALNKNQMASKKWLIDELYRAQGGTLGTVYILGGWYGILSAMLLNDERIDIDCAVSFDMDSACEPIAAYMNRSRAEKNQFFAVTADVNRIEYPVAIAGKPNGGSAPDVVINTSCEHMDPGGGWYDRIPDGAILVLQSNNQFDCAEHQNCVDDLDMFRRQSPMTEIMFAGELERKRYTRFMLMGRK
jgi:hypothetical protein